MQAIPTLFQGRVFKSKSEAMFANILEQMKGYRNYLRWVYEPDQFKTKAGYIPDFIIYEGDELFLADWIYLIEYKPSKPTDQYVDYLALQFEEIKKKDCYHFIDNCYLIYGNCFDGTFRKLVYEFDCHMFFEDINSVSWINNTMIERAKSHRYDLEITF